MKRFLLTLFVVCILSVYAVSHAYGQARQVKYDDYCIVLITSAQCGYCIVNTGWFNSLADKYSDDIQMVALSESKQKTIDKLKTQFPDRDVTLKGWELIPNARHLISKIGRTGNISADNPSGKRQGEETLRRHYPVGKRRC